MKAKTMTIKVSTPMMKALKQAMPDYTVTLEKFTPHTYRMFVDIDDFLHDEDYSIQTGMFKAIRIGYPPEYYANPLYITSRELHKLFQNSDKTYNGFIDKVKAYCEI